MKSCIRSRINTVCVAAAGTALLTMAPLANAYEVYTHQKLTRAAFRASVMADTTRGPLGALDIPDPRQRFMSIPSSNYPPVFVTADELVSLGANYEDHPELDLRFMRHFFDPQQGGKGLLVYEPSPEWVIEPGGSTSIPRQEFSLADALVYYRQALTGTTPQTRERPKILLLQTMGHAVHHLQDMSQPAHTRNDIHPPWEGDPYESMTEDLFAFGGRSLPLETTCGEGTIDLRRFDQYAKFWANGGAGVAEFTSTNFVSRDTIFRSTGSSWTADSAHPLPEYPVSPIFDTPRAADVGIHGNFPDSRLRFLGLPVLDQNTGRGCFNPRAAMETFSSAWSSAANAPITLGTKYALNSLTYEENYRILFPRAVAYSAAMLDYFFRGRLEIASYAVVNSEVQLVVRNASAAAFTMSPASSGEEFSIYYDAQGGARRRMALRNDDIPAEIHYGDTYTLSFPMPTDVDTSLEKPFTLMFEGTIGAAPGIAAVKVGEVRGALLVTPNYVPSDGIVGARLIDKDGNGWKLTSAAGARAGNVDWRGHASEDVLTWDGPQGRYFGAANRSANIYRGGKVLAVAPAAVLGVAIQNGGSQRYLLAAVSDNGLRIYRRPYQASYQRNDLYDEMNNPGGWQLIHSQPISPSSPLFFNASGTEGQIFAGPNVRYRIRITGSSVNSTQLSNAGSFTRAIEYTQEQTGSADVDPGPPLMCRARGSRCVGARGSCTTPDGYHNTNVCLVSQEDEDVSTGTRRDQKIIRDNVTSTVVCADYRGDAEILCHVEADETVDHYMDTSIGQWDSTHIRTINQACQTTPSGTGRYEHNFDSVETGSPTMVFKMGSRSIPLSGVSYRREKHYNSVAEWNYGTPPPDPTVSYSYFAEDIDYDTKIMYADARYGILAYEDHQRIHTKTGSGGGATAMRSNWGGEMFFYAQVQGTIRTVTKVVLHAGQDYQLSSRTIEEPGLSGNYVENTGFRDFPPENCEAVPAATSGSSTTQEFPPFRFFADSIHRQVDAGVSQSLSALSADQFVASIPIWIRRPDDSYEREGTWNHLSGGELPALIPGAPSSPSYLPTGIAR